MVRKVFGCFTRTGNFVMSGYEYIHLDLMMGTRTSTSTLVLLKYKLKYTYVIGFGKMLNAVIGLLEATCGRENTFRS